MSGGGGGGSGVWGGGGVWSGSDLFDRFCLHYAIVMMSA